MRLATTTCDLNELTVDPMKAVEELKDAGFKYIDLSFYSMDKNPSPFMQDGWEEYALSLKRYAEKLGVTFVQSHAPGSYNPFDTEHRAELVKATNRAIEVCAILGIKNTVIHTGWREGITKEESFKENYDFIKELLPTAEKCGVNILTENSTRVNMGEQYVFYDGKTMKEFYDYVKHPLVHGCWDVGHAHLEGHNYQDIIDLGDDLYAVHIHDNRCGHDEHMLPYMGTINMDEIITALIDISFKGYFTFECDSIFFSHRYRSPFERSQKLLKPTPNMIRLKEKFLFEMGKEMLREYRIYEE